MMDDASLRFPLGKALLRLLQLLLIPYGLLKTLLFFWLSRRNREAHWGRYLLPQQGDAASIIISAWFYFKTIVTGGVMLLGVLHRSAENFYMLMFCLAYILRSGTHLIFLIATAAAKPMDDRIS